MVREQHTRALYEKARAAWPAFAVERAAFEAFFTERGLAIEALDEARAADAYLVIGCLAGDPAAVTALVKGPLAACESSLRRHLPSPEARADELQAMTVHMLTAGDADPDNPRLAQYHGRAALEAWLRISATRRALRRLEREGRNVAYDQVAFDKASESDPEMSMLRRQYRDDIAAIFREAIAAVTPEDRVLLRLHYVEGLTLNALAVLRKTSRSGVHRQLESARAILFERIGGLVRQKLRLSSSQQGSMLRIFESDLREALGILLKP